MIYYLTKTKFNLSTECPILSKVITEIRITKDRITLTYIQNCHLTQTMNFSSVEQLVKFLTQQTLASNSPIKTELVPTIQAFERDLIILNSCPNLDDLSTEDNKFVIQGTGDDTFVDVCNELAKKNFYYVILA